MYRPDAPHGVTAHSVPTSRNEIDKPKSATRSAVAAICRNGSEKMSILQEALARARMYEIWRHERPPRRGARQINNELRRRRVWR